MKSVGIAVMRNFIQTLQAKDASTLLKNLGNEISKPLYAIDDKRYKLHQQSNTLKKKPFHIVVRKETFIGQVSNIRNLSLLNPLRKI